MASSTPDVFVVVKRAPLRFAGAGLEDALKTVPEVVTGGAAGLVVEIVQAAKGKMLASAMSADELAFAKQFPDGTALEASNGQTLNVQLIPHAPKVANTTQNFFFPEVLWPATHDLWEKWLAPRFGGELREAWNCYKQFVDDYALTLIGEARDSSESVFMIQDYQFVGLPTALRSRGVAGRISLFDHCAWAGPDAMRPLPRDICHDILRSICLVDWFGMYSRRWIGNFLHCVEEFVPEAEVDLQNQTVHIDGHLCNTGVVKLGYSPNAIDQLDLSVPRDIAEWIGNDNLVVIYGRTDANKNLPREIEAFRRAVLQHGEIRGVKLLIRLSPHNLHVQMVRRCYDEILREIEMTRNTLGADSVFVVEENSMARTLASYRRADVLLFAPIMDGQNLSPFEAIMVNERNAGVIVSELAGASEVLRDVVYVVNPYDTDEQAAAIAEILKQPCEQRAEAAQKQRAVAQEFTVERWIDEQLHAIGLKKGVEGGEAASIRR